MSNETLAAEIVSDTLPLPKGVSSDEMLQLLDLARWAPSGDNSQPWGVRAGANQATLNVIAMGTASPAFLDVNLDATRMAIGAFVENLEWASSALGIPLDCDFLPDGPTRSWARVVFAQGRTSGRKANGDIIRARVSNRKIYEKNSCTAKQLDSLRESIDHIPAVNLQMLTQTEQLESLARVVGMTDRVRMLHAKCHLEFHEKIRWTNEQSHPAPVGFYYKTFEIGAIEAIALRLTRWYPVMQCVDALTGMSHMAANVARRQVVNSGAVGLLYVPSSSHHSLLWAGRALQRLWLKATQLGLAFQVLGVAPLFIRRCIFGSDGFNETQCAVISEARSILESTTKRCAADLALMCRIGRTSPPSSRCARRPATDLILR